MQTPTLQQLRRAMNEDPRNMPPDVLAWAIDLIAARCELIPSGAPARQQYDDRLAVLRLAARS